MAVLIIEIILVEQRNRESIRVSLRRAGGNKLVMVTALYAEMKNECQNALRQYAVMNVSSLNTASGD